MKSLISLFFTISLLLCVASAFADKATDIYKWTDSDGRVHYAARPGDAHAQKMHLGSHRFKNTHPDTSKAEKEARERAATCKISKETLVKYEKAPFLYRYDNDKQQKVRLNKKESEEAMLQAKKDVAYWCDNQDADNADVNLTEDNNDSNP